MILIRIKWVEEYVTFNLDIKTKKKTETENLSLRSLERFRRIYSSEPNWRDSFLGSNLENDIENADSLCERIDGCQSMNSKGFLSLPIIELANYPITIEIGYMYFIQEYNNFRRHTSIAISNKKSGKLNHGRRNIFN